MPPFLSNRQAGLLAGLMYPIIFEQNPLDGVERTLEAVVHAGAMNSQPADFLAAIQAGLASTKRLSKLLPQPHAEQAIRAYLTELERRIAADLKP